jgi:hypothetical protein
MGWDTLIILTFIPLLMLFPFPCLDAFSSIHLHS